MDSLLKSSLFTPQAGFNRGVRKTLAPTAFQETIPYFTLPEAATSMHRIHFGMYLIFCGTSTTGRRTHWRSWVVTWCCSVTPNFVTQLPATTFRRLEIDMHTLDQLSQIMQAFELTFEGITGDDAYNASLAALVGFEGVPGLPPMNSTVNFGATNGEWSSRVIVSYYTIVLFLAGKRPEGDDHSQITVARPRALRGKCDLGDSIACLDGPVRMSDYSHLRINSAWSEMGLLRSVVFSEYAYYDSESSDFIKDIIWTSIHLLQYANMAHAKITYNFLQAYPWASEVPSLRNSIAIYMNSVQTASKMDPVLFPFIKLIYGDKSGIFPRKEMEPLIACATAVQRETTQSLSEFYTNAAFNPIVDAFIQEKDRRERIRKLNIQKEEKDLVEFMDIEDDEAEAL
jgi:hypothetical protein